MSTALATTGDFTNAQMELIKQQIAPGASDAELALFVNICKRTGLDPFSKQIYCIKRKGKMVTQTGIDGYRAIADRQGNYAGSDDPLFDDGQTEYQMRNAGFEAPLTATVTVWKIVAGVRCPFTATASWDSYCPPPDNNQDAMWRKMGYLMLAKCAEALALRKGWATQMSGLYTDAEMQQAGPAEFSEAHAGGSTITREEYAQVKALSRGYANAGDHAQDAIDAEIVDLAGKHTMARTEAKPPERASTTSRQAKPRQQPAAKPQAASDSMGQWYAAEITNCTAKSGTAPSGKQWTNLNFTLELNGKRQYASSFEVGAAVRVLGDPPENYRGPVNLLIEIGEYNGKPQLKIHDFDLKHEPAQQGKGYTEIVDDDPFDIGELGPPVFDYDAEEDGLSRGA